MQNNKSPSEIRLQDPLSPVTRNERKVLLGVSAIGIVIAKSGLIPSRISALGVDFDHADQAALLTMLSAIIAYFVVAFIVYASSDLVAWRVSYHNASLESSRAREKERRGLIGRELEPGHETIEIMRRGTIWRAAGRPMSLVRALFEFGVPITISAYAMWVLGTMPPRPIDVLTPAAGSPQIQDSPAGPTQSTSPEPAPSKISAPDSQPSVRSPQTQEVVPTQPKELPQAGAISPPPR